MAFAVGAQPPASLRVQTVATNLEHPWAVAFLPQGRFLVSERPGRLRVIEPDGRLGVPIAGLPPVDAVGQGGLLDVVLDSDFARNRTLYFCFAQPQTPNGGNATALARAVLSADATRLEQVRVIFRQQPAVASRLHFGCRIVEAPDGTLFLTLGERYHRMADAQTLDNHLGKVVRVTKDGAVPSDNPFVGHSDALPEIWSYGHRNPQGAVWGPDGRLWIHEHGPQGGDEINRPPRGGNHGWPVVTFGEQYGGGRIGEGTHKPGMVAPLYHWTPSIAPSGMAFLRSERYGAAWRGNLFIGALRGQHLLRLELDGTRVVREQRLLTELRARIRDVREGPDGWLYLLTDAPDGRLLRVLPADL
ncbi:PQQ-dependent sugar dehydrogenase [Tepidimonas charontis]|uniref:Aldose sugar dehydrogenase YliI n=1 Tax=Tepidimonas charontis TaxID=2267262 RepID=A0A554XBA7_9BURK|nr:PQQ-dependent sugar dehydrogenase [Tepidimonas charontis]TSE33076.1 Aldose sugar dehydrogenase YliI [Tepidimonas charontis]